jgi:hypothetical protein
MLPNRSRLVGIVDVEDTTRGFSAVSMLIFDEAALVSDELYRAMRPTLAPATAPSGSCPPRTANAASSTANGPAAKTGGNSPSKQPDCPRIPAAFLEQEQRDLGPDFFEQEYMCHFFAPLDAIFDEPTVRRAVIAGPGPIFTGTYDLAHEDTYHMLKREFLIGVDLGQRRDHSAIVVIEVAEIASKDRSAVTFAPAVTTRRTVRHIEQIRSEPRSPTSSSESPASPINSWPIHPSVRRQPPSSVDATG